MEKLIKKIKNGKGDEEGEHKKNPSLWKSAVYEKIIQNLWGWNFLL